MALGKNLLANSIGQAWTGLIGLVFIPVYIYYMGVEAFGLIGIFGMLQAWLVLLDLGMTPTLNREMARFSAGQYSSEAIRDLLRSLEVVAIAIAILTALGLWGASNWLASDWLRTKELPISTVANAIAIMGWVASLRLIESIYKSSLLGLQKHIFFNAANSIIATVRALGAVAVLAWVSPTINAYFAWQVLVSVLSVSFLAIGTYAKLPRSSVPAKFSKQALLEVRSFIGGMMATTVLVLLLTQLDKLLLSRLLSLEAFGHYIVATSVAMGLSLLITPTAQTFFPRFSQLIAQGDGRKLIQTYHFGAQLVSAIAVPAAFMAIFFAPQLLELWMGNFGLAQEVAPLVALLMLGALLNGLMQIPYMLQLAEGWTSLTVRVNIASVCVLVPSILWAVPRYGAMGAAWIWVILNAGYVLIGAQLMYRRLLEKEKWKWYGRDIGVPILTALIVTAVFKWILSFVENKVAIIALILTSLMLTYFFVVSVSPLLRRQIAFMLLRRKIRIRE